MLPGVLTAYGAIWFSNLGFSEAQISILNSVPIFIVLILNFLIGRLADRANDWRTTIIIGSLFAAISLTGILYSQDYWVILVCLTISNVAMGTTVPVVDAAAVRLADRMNYGFGVQRAWGTIGYLILLMVTGEIIARFGDASYIWLLLLAAFLRMQAAFFLPKFRAPKLEVAPIQGLVALASVMRPWFILPLLGYGIINGSHMILNAFHSLILARQGYEPLTISLIISLGAVAETIMFVLFSKISSRMSSRGFLAIAGVATVVRWVAFGFEPTLFWLIPLQLMHAITFALGFVAIVRFISRHVIEENAAEAQGLMAMIQQIMTIVAMLGFGFFVAQLGIQAFWVAAGYAALGTVCVFVSLILRTSSTDGPIKR